MPRLQIRRTKEELAELKAQKKAELARRKAQKEAENRVYEWKCPQCTACGTAPDQKTADQTKKWHVVDFHDERARFRQSVRDGMAKKKKELPR
jgi:hypothetical protein